MRCLINCRDCSVVLIVLPGTPDSALPDLCSQIEEQNNDDYAVVAWNNRWIADSEGLLGVLGEGSPPYDAATATGMYDRDF